MRVAGLRSGLCMLAVAAAAFAAGCGMDNPEVRKFLDEVEGFCNRMEAKLQKPYLTQSERASIESEVMALERENRRLVGKRCSRRQTQRMNRLKSRLDTLAMQIMSKPVRSGPSRHDPPPAYRPPSGGNEPVHQPEPPSMSREEAWEAGRRSIEHALKMVLDHM